MRSRSHRARSVASVALLAAAVSSAGAATVRFDNFLGDNLWESTSGTNSNWLQTGGIRTLPGTADTAEVGGTFSASISSAQSVGQLIVGDGTSSSSYPVGTATLNILPGANLSLTQLRLGRAYKVNVGDNKGVVNQTGGSISITTGSTGFKLSDDNITSADSLYTISGGSLRGGATNGTMANPIRVGDTTAAGRSFNRAEFRVVGSGASEIRVEDFRIAPGAGTGGTRDAVAAFYIGSTGVTPITAEDELRIAAGSLLDIQLTDAPPAGDIFLFRADRLTSGTNGSETNGSFFNMPDGTLITRSFGGVDYSWNLRYFEDDANLAGGDGVIGSYVKLEAVPEPAALSLLALAAGPFLGRRKR